MTVFASMPCQELTDHRAVRSGVVQVIAGWLRFNAEREEIAPSSDSTHDAHITHNPPRYGSSGA